MMDTGINPCQNLAVQWLQQVNGAVEIHGAVVSRDIPVQIFSQQGYSSTKYSVSRDIPVQNI
jgi:hypothetical protein